MGRRLDSTGSSTACGRSAIARPGPTSIRAASRRTPRRASAPACSGTFRLPDPWVIQGLPAEAERRFAVGRIVVERRDEDSVADGPEGAEEDQVQRGGAGRAEAPRPSDDAPPEGDG